MSDNWQIGKEKKKGLLKELERAILVGVVKDGQTVEQVDEYLDELDFLANTAGAEIIKKFTQKLKHPDPRTFIGSGKLEEIRLLLPKMDVPARQVMIEARVVVATDGWSRDLGARLGFSATKTGNLFGDQHQADAIGLGQALPAVNGAGNLALSLLNLANGNLLSLELRALEADNKGKVISNPRVMTSNQKPAVILNGTQIPYITPGTANSPATVTFKDAFLCLLVDPQILNNDAIILTVEVQKDAVRDIANIGDNPAIDTKRIKTQVRVNNGETLVLGGIYDGGESSTTSKVPLLGDMPVLGNLFKTTTKENSKTELIIFITPRIIDERLSLR